MGRNKTGGAYASRGKFYARPVVGGERQSVLLPTITSMPEARKRAVVIAGVVAKLEQHGHQDRVERFIATLAKAGADELGEVVAIADGLCDGTEIKTGLHGDLPTFRDVGEGWTSGDLARKYPDHVRVKRSVANDRARLAILYETIGNVPLKSFTLDDAQRAMTAVATRPARIAGRTIEPTARAQYAQVISRVLALAVWPLRLLTHSPLPKGFLPKSHGRKARQFLYPAEEAQLLACKLVPLGYRILLGVLAREGLRSRTEAGTLLWGDLDLKNAVLTLRANKTDDPRAWCMGPDVARALTWWRENTKAPTGASDPVFTHRDGAELEIARLSAMQRGFLLDAGVTRRELHEHTVASLRLRAHDLRGTFVTLALASGRAESWVCDRTGHQSSAELYGYRRAARRAEELALGWLAPMDEAIPEIAHSGDAIGDAPRASGTKPAEYSPIPSDSHGSGHAVSLSHPSQIAGEFVQPPPHDNQPQGGAADSAATIGTAQQRAALQAGLGAAVGRGDLRTARVLLDELERLEAASQRAALAAKVTPIGAARKRSDR